MADVARWSDRWKIHSDNIKEPFKEVLGCNKRPVQLSRSNKKCERPLQEDKVAFKGRIKLMCQHDEAPLYMQFNPYIHRGYRINQSAWMCLESLFWWNNETINVWSHVFGWLLTAETFMYDLYKLEDHVSLGDRTTHMIVVISGLICMTLSCLYHTFSCLSEDSHKCFLHLDLLGITQFLLVIYLSGIYYAFWCNKEWLFFYMGIVAIFFLASSVLQIPHLQISHNVKTMMFVVWCSFGMLPTLHLTILYGGWSTPAVKMFLPRILVMYLIGGLAFFFYVSKVPERLMPGRVDYIGASHQVWHLLVVLAIYYWHNTGAMYIKYRMNHACLSFIQLS